MSILEGLICKNRDRTHAYITLRTSHMQKKMGIFHVKLVSYSAGAQLLSLALYPTFLTTRSYLGD